MMDIKGKIGTFSFKLAVGFAAFYLLGLFAPAQYNNLISFQPSLILEDMQFWRIISYPLSLYSPESCLLFLSALVFFGPLNEKVFRLALYPYILSLLIVIQGVVFTLVFWKSGMALSGLGGIAVFLFTMPLLLSRVRKGVFVSAGKSEFMIMSAVIVVWAASIITRGYYTNNMELIYGSMASAGFGLISAVIINIQFRLTTRKILGQEDLSEYSIPKPEELSPAIIAKAEINEIDAGMKREYMMPVSLYDLPMNEDGLNTILDKINKSGKESLTREEMEFLREYSRKL